VDLPCLFEQRRQWHVLHLNFAHGENEGVSKICDSVCVVAKIIGNCRRSDDDNDGLKWEMRRNVIERDPEIGTLNR
jgi:hypothetical protein